MENPKDILEKLLKSHDWWYMMSDDPKVYDKGAKQEEAIKLLKDKVGNEYDALYNKYAPEEFKTTVDYKYNPKNPKALEEQEDKIDTISMDIPLFIRMLEYAREDAAEDVDLHDVTEKANLLCKERGILSMEDYDEIVNISEEPLNESNYNDVVKEEEEEKLFLFSEKKWNKMGDKRKNDLLESLGIGDYGEDEMEWDELSYETQRELMDYFEDKFEDSLNELKEQESGLWVYSRGREETNKLKEIIDNSDYYGEYDSEFGGFFFPESEDNYDKLEEELTELFDEKGLENYRFEGVFGLDESNQEQVFKELKPAKHEFVKRYGKDAEKVMRGRAANLSKVDENIYEDEIEDAFIEACDIVGSFSTKREFAEEFINELNKIEHNLSKDEVKNLINSGYKRLKNAGEEALIRWDDSLTSNEREDKLDNLEENTDKFYSVMRQLQDRGVEDDVVDVLSKWYHSTDNKKAVIDHIKTLIK